MFKFIVSVILFIPSQTETYPDVLYFGAEQRCAPCVRMQPILNNLTKNYDVVRINVDANQEFAKTYNINSIPVIIILKNGVEVRRFVGYTEESTLRHALKNK